jgi:hypothetical protein
MLSQDAAKVEDSSNSVVKQMCWKSVDGDENKPKKLYLRYYAFDLWTFYSSTTFKVPDHPDSPGSGFATAQKLLKDGWGYV